MTAAIRPASVVRRATLIPVSYTHLDVYKRQVLDAADSIRTMLLDYPAPTIAFINNQAASAGALIALAADSIYSCV